MRHAKLLYPEIIIINSNKWEIFCKRGSKQVWLISFSLIWRYWNDLLCRRKTFFLVPISWPNYQTTSLVKFWIFIRHFFFFLCPIWHFQMVGGLVPRHGMKNCFNLVQCRGVCLGGKSITFSGQIYFILIFMKFTTLKRFLFFFGLQKLQITKSGAIFMDRKIACFQLKMNKWWIQKSQVFRWGKLGIQKQLFLQLLKK